MPSEVAASTGPGGPFQQLARAWWKEGIDTDNDDLCKRAMTLWETIAEVREQLAAAARAVI